MKKLLSGICILLFSLSYLQARPIYHEKKIIKNVYLDEEESYSLNFKELSGEFVASLISVIISDDENGANQKLLGKFHVGADSFIVTNKLENKPQTPSISLNREDLVGKTLTVFYVTFPYTHIGVVNPNFNAVLDFSVVNSNNEVIAAFYQKNRENDNQYTQLINDMGYDSVKMSRRIYKFFEKE